MVITRCTSLSRVYHSRFNAIFFVTLSFVFFSFMEEMPWVLLFLLLLLAIFIVPLTYFGH
jgi:hypothetical protein